MMMMTPRWIRAVTDVCLVSTQGFWRLYELDCPGVLNCRILECFLPDTFHLTEQA